MLAFVLGLPLWVLFCLAVAVFKAVQYIVWLASARSVAGEVALITGGGSGIGRLTALELARAGARIVLWDLNEAGLAQVAREITELGGQVQTAKMDVTARDAVYAAVRDLDAGGWAVDILINNAGIVSGKPFAAESDAFSEKTVQVNTIAHFWTVKAVLPSMSARNKGHIVTIASAAGLNGVAGLSSYCASKFGAVGFDEALRLELRKNGLAVRTTCVMPFYVATDLFKGAKGVPFLLSIQDPGHVARRIVQAIRHGEKQVFLPPILAYLQMVKALVPTGVSDFLAHVTGVSKSMDEFCGTGEDHARKNK